MAELFVVITEYTTELAEVDAHRDDHIRWIHEHYDSGRILVSGRRSPPHGGAIVMRATDRAEANAVLDTDPFAAAGIVERRLYPFTPTRPASLDSAVAAFIDGDAPPLEAPR